MKKLLAIITVTLLAAGAAALACGEKASVTGCLKSAESIERTVKNLDDGVKIMLASNVPAMVEQLHATGGRCKSDCEKQCPMAGESVNRVVDKTDNGVVITATSADADVVKALQKHAGSAKGGCSKSKGATQASNDGGSPCMKNKGEERVAANR